MIAIAFAAIVAAVAIIIYEVEVYLPEQHYAIRDLASGMMRCAVA
jgi:hypothetical protein